VGAALRGHCAADVKSALYGAVHVRPIAKIKDVVLSDLGLRDRWVRIDNLQARQNGFVNLKEQAAQIQSAGSAECFDGEDKIAVLFDDVDLS
jgi:hypothetical protein